MIILPYLISCLTGILLVRIFLMKEKSSNLPLQMILGCGLGLGISSHFAFYGFLLYDHLCPELTINSQLLLLAGLLGYFLYSRRKNKISFSVKKLSWPELAILAGFMIMFFFVIKAALVFPKGGWDAWQVWNFKARFLFLAGSEWHNLFDPQLWRTSPHYPLLLPLINVWVWMIAGPDKNLDLAPLWTSVLFTMLTCGLVSAGLWAKTRQLLAATGGLLLLCLPFFNLLATSQYCDIVLAFFLLAALMTLGESFNKDKTFYACLSGLFTGFLGFSKPEGMVAALLLAGLTGGLWLFSLGTKRRFFTNANFYLFFLGLLLASIPTVAFHYLYSPGNQTFINGLTSNLKPSTPQRLWITLSFLASELKQARWGGMWFLVLLGIILAGKNAWRGTNLLVGFFFLLYFSVIVAYYYVNTYFEIKWWLDVTLNRILFSLLPLAVYWTFSAVFAKSEK